MIYRVLLNGENFLLDFDGKVQKLGFYTTRDVAANSSQEAENNAVAALRNDDFLKAQVLNKKDDPPMIFVEEIRTLTEGENSTKFGFSFYHEDGKR